MYCRKCGLTFDETVKYCTQCGAELISDLDAMGLNLFESQEGAFKKFYRATSAQMRDYLYHRVPFEDLANAIEEFYSNLLIAVKTYNPDTENFTEWFHTFLNRFVLKYTGIHALFSGEEERYRKAMPEPTSSEIRVDKDITMREDKRIYLLSQIMEGVTEKERICLSLRYIEQMTIAEIAREMHTTEPIISHYFYSGNEKLYQNFNHYEIGQHNSLFGMNEISFIIWLLQYDDKARMNMSLEKILNQIEINNPEGVVAEYRPLQEPDEAMSSIPVKARESRMRQLTYREPEELEEELEEQPVQQQPQQAAQNVNAAKPQQNVAPQQAAVEPDDEYDDEYDDEEESGNTFGDIIIKVGIGLCVIVLVALVVMIGSNFVPKSNKNKADQGQVTTQNAEEKSTATAKVVTRLDIATQLYQDYMKDKNKIGCFYAIIEAGENKDPMLIIVSNTETLNSDHAFAPSINDQGYTINEVYIIENEKVVQLSNEILQAEEDGAWRLYHNKLSSYLNGSDRGRVRTMEVTGSSYKLLEIMTPDDYSSAEIIQLTQFMGEDTTEETTEATTEETIEGVDVDKTVAITSDTLNVREKPSAASEKLYQLSYGDEVNIIMEAEDSEGHTWGQISTGGWIRMDYTADPESLTTEATEVTTEATEATTEETTESTTESEATEATTQAQTEGGKEVTIYHPAGGLRVHTEPSASSTTVRTLENDTKVTVYKIQGSWGQLSDGNWICIDYTR